MKPSFTLRSLHSAILSAALLAASASLATAQTQLEVTAAHAPGSAAVTWSPSGFGSFNVSPYTGLILSSDPAQQAVLTCVDFFHHIALNTPWNATKTVLSGNLNNTRFNNLTEYLEAAWLSQQFGTDPGAHASRTIAIQSAIWQLFTPAAPKTTLVSSSNPDSYLYWLNAAQNNYQSISAANVFVYTPVNKSDASSAQEFLVVVPEPATSGLLTAGLLVVGGMIRRRRRTARMVEA